MRAAAMNEKKERIIVWLFFIPHPSSLIPFLYGC